MLPKVLIVAKRLDIGGAEQHIRRIVPSLKRRGLNVSLFLLERGGVLEEHLLEAGVEIVGSIRALPRYFHLASATWQLARHIRRARPDIVHYFLSEPYLVGNLATLATQRVTQIMSRRSLNDYQLHHPFLARIERWVHGRTQVLLGNSTAVVADLFRESSKRNKIGLIPNGIDVLEPVTPKSRRNMRAALGLTDDMFVICVCANLIPYKGHRDLFDALGLIRNRLPSNWRILVIGRDEGIGHELREKSKALGFEGNVIWLEEQRDAQTFLDAVDVSIFPSHQEGFSNSLIEAMAKGIPVIATAVGGNLDAIEQGVSGVLVPVRDPRALSYALLSLSRDTEKRNALAANALTRVSAHFSLDECITRYMRLYRGWPYSGEVSIQKIIDPVASLEQGAAKMDIAKRRGRRMAYLALDVPHEGQASDTHISEIINNLRHLGWSIDLFSPISELKSSVKGRVARALDYLGIQVRVIWNLGKFDVLYVRAHLLAWPATFAARRCGVAVVQEVNGTERDVIIAHPWLRHYHSLIKWLYQSQYRMSDHLLPVTQKLQEWLRNEAGHDRIHVISNAANTDLFFPIETLNENPFVVFFGSLTNWHGVEVMMDAVNHPKWPKSVELVVIGAGAKQNLIKAAVQAGAPVRYLGHRRYREIPRLIAGAVAGLIPITNPEGRSSTGVMPLKLFEMLACGMPVIVSDLPGQAELVRDNNCGVVIPCGDAEALADTVARLAADPEWARAMGRRGAALIREEHSWSARAAEIDRILESSLAGGRSFKNDG